MPLSNKRKAILHIAKAALKLSDERYRCALIVIAGVTSSTELDQDGFEAIMGYLEWLGFKPLEKTGPSYGNRPGMASFAQLELIRALWREWSGTIDKDLDQTGLTTWLKRSFKRDSLRFVTATDARKIISALMMMKTHKRKAA